jgi:hypothetical protein
MNLEDVEDKIWDSVWKSMRCPVRNPVWNSVHIFVRDPVWNSVNIGLQLPIREERAGK